MSSVTQTSCSVKTSISSNLTPEEILVELPIEYENDSVILNRKHMEAGTPFPFTFDGHWLIAIKKDDESIEVYYLPEKEDEE